MKVTKTGYRKDSPDKKEEAVIIPSNQISMKDTEYEEIFAVPFKDGKPMKMVLMKRGGEYNFEGADYVMEIPKLQTGIGNIQYQNTLSIPNVFMGTNQFQNSIYQGSNQNIPQQNNGVRPDPDGGEYFNLPGGNGVTEEVETVSNNPNTFNPNSFNNLLEQYKDKDWSISSTIGETETDNNISSNTDSNNRYNAESSKKEGVYNPYSSYDTRAAANILGRVIGGDGNKATGAAAGLKIGTSLLRDVMSGVGTAKRNKQQEEKYNENQRKGLTGNYQQEGGAIRNIEEVENVTGVRFSEDYANEYFTREVPEQEILPPPTKVDLGRYQGRGFFEIQDNGTEVIVLPTQKNPLTKDDYKRSLDYLREKNPGVKFSRNSYIPKRDRGTEEEVVSLQEGGEIKLEESLTGEYIQGMPEGKEDQGVVEVEGGEHIVQPDGTVSEVKGDKHSKGGEKLSAEQVQEGSIVISDYTPIGGENAKYFKEKYGIKVKAKDTYATVVDKVKSKIGIDKIVKEQEEVFKKIEKQEKETENDATKNLNLQFLSGKVKELEEKKTALEPQRMEVMKEVFQRQEASKPAEERAQVDPQMMATLSQESGMDPQQVQQVIEQFLRGGTYFDLKKYQGGTGSVTYSKEDAEKIKEFSQGSFSDKFTLYNDVVYNEDGTVTITPKNPDTPIDGYYKTGWEKLGLSPIENTQQEEQVDPLMSTEEMVAAYKDLKKTHPNLMKDKTEPGEGIVTGEEIGDKRTVEKEKEYNSPFVGGRPDQSVLPPSSANLPMKAETRLQRADGINISPEAALVENQRQANAMMKYVSSLPPAQQVLMMNQIQQQAAQNSNEVIGKAASQTAQVNNSIDMFNIGQADKENVAASQNALSYEDRAFKTQAAYEENLLQYYDFLRNVNTQNYNDIKNENTVNSMFENYQIDSQGNLVVKTNSGQSFTIPRTAGIVEPEKATKKTKKTRTV